jgi:integrase
VISDVISSATGGLRAQPRVAAVEPRLENVSSSWRGGGTPSTQRSSHTSRRNFPAVPTAFAAVVRTVSGSGSTRGYGSPVFPSPRGCRLNAPTHQHLRENLSGRRNANVLHRLSERLQPALPHGVCLRRLLCCDHREQVLEELVRRAWTKRSYRDSIDLALIPRFGRRKIGEIDAGMIARLIRDLEERGLNALDPKRPVRPMAASTIQNHLKPLSGTLAYALRRGLISSNPFLALTSDDRPPNGNRRSAYEWSDDEIQALLEAVDARAAKREAQQDYSTLMRTAVYTGLRLGELLGLQWQDVDLDDGVLHVRRQWTRLGELAPPKTKKGIRRVPLSTEMVTLLRRHKLASSCSQDEHHVFSSRTSGPLSHRNVQRRAWEPARDAAGLPSELGFHSLRHAFASIAAHRGVPASTLSEVMGHADVGVTLSVYTHLFDRAKAEQAFRAAMGAS